MITRFAFFLLFAACAAAPLAHALGPDETEIVLDKGNIELSIVDGTTLSVGAGTHLTIEHAKGPGQITRINVLKGQFRVSNVFHKHSGLVLIQVGNHAFELSRGTALIASTDSGPQATLLHGKSLGLQGAANRLTTPGMRLNVPKGGGAARRERPDPASINEMMNRVSGRSKPARGNGRDIDRQRRSANRKPGQKREGAQVIKRSDLKTLTDQIQGKGLPKPQQRPPNPNGQRPAHGGQGMNPRPPQGGQGMRPRPPQGGQGQGPMPPQGGQGHPPRHGGMNGGNPPQPQPHPNRPPQPVLPPPQPRQL